MKCLLVPLIALSMIVPALAQDVAEPKTGVKFAAKDSDTSLLGVGLRTKTFAKVKVYAIGLYVADSAIAGPLKGKTGSPELYRQLVTGDFKKKVVMKFVRNVSASQIQDAFRESLKNSGAKTEEWLAYFTDVRSGQEFVIGWNPGVGLETKVAGADKQAINDKALASAIFGIWLGDKPIQDDLKKDLVARGGELLK
jgi:chalcone isomerase-like protein